MTLIKEVIENKKTNLNPIWSMRQAGRYLPEFREIRNKNQDFVRLCLNDNLSSEITLQPIMRFDLFSLIFSIIFFLSEYSILPVNSSILMSFSKNLEANL